VSLSRSKATRRLTARPVESEHPFAATNPFSNNNNVTKTA
jgi:hypothetical protein